MDTEASKFKEVERLYNSTVKQAFKFPQKGIKVAINNFMGTFTMKNIIQRNYGVNALKW